MSPEEKKVRKIKAKNSTPTKVQAQTQAQIQPQPTTQFQSTQVPPEQLAPVFEQPQQIPQQPQSPAQPPVYQQPAQTPFPQQPPAQPMQPPAAPQPAYTQTPTYAQPQQPAMAAPPGQLATPMTQHGKVPVQGSSAQQTITQPIVEKPAKGKAKAKRSRRGKANKATKPTAIKNKGKIKYSQYRYRTSLLKGTFLPILFMVMSFLMLNNAVYEFQGFFEYDMNMILFGLVLGLVIMIGIPIANAARAKNKPNTGTSLNVLAGVVIVLVYIVADVAIAMFINLALAWQFSMGFFAAAFFPALIIGLYEIASKGKLYIQEPPDDVKEERKLVFVPS